MSTLTDVRREATRLFGRARVAKPFRDPCGGAAWLLTVQANPLDMTFCALTKNGVLAEAYEQLERLSVRR